MANSPDPDKRRRITNPTEELKKDWREFICQTWHLEPTVRIMSWAGKSIEPYGVDYILQKLGFSHARTTIPKWIQRGFMDPVDKVLSVILEKLIVYVSQDEDKAKEKSKQTSADETFKDSP